MIILHTETLKKWGGQQNRVLSEVIGLKRRGHKVVIACNKGSVLAHKAKEAGLRLFEVNMSKRAHIANIPKLMCIIRREGIEIVATHSSVDSWSGGIAAKLTGRRLIRFRHNLYPVGRDPLSRLIYSIPDRIIAISNTIKHSLENSGLKSEKIKVIPSSVNTVLYSPDVEDLRKELKIPQETTVIGNTSSFTPVKGQKYLLQAFNALNKKFSCILLFAGRLNEPYKSQYLSYVSEDLRKKVFFLGHMNDIPRVLKTIDIFVFPSLVEGLGTSLLEAMAVGKPVVVSDITTFKEFIIDKVNGVFFRTEDYKDLAEEVFYIKENDFLKTQLGKNARSTVIDGFSVNKMLNQTEIIYKEVLNAR